MVLADTSVWIDYFNGVSNWQAERLDLLLDTEPVAFRGPDPHGGPAGIPRGR